MQVAASTRFWAEHRHSWLHTQQEGRVLGSVHSVQRHFPQCSQRRRCFFSAGEEGITATLCWPPVGHTPPADIFAAFRSIDLKEEQEEAEEEEVRTLVSEEVKLAGLRALIVFRGPWWGCRFR